MATNAAEYGRIVGLRNHILGMVAPAISGLGAGCGVVLPAALLCTFSGAFAQPGLQGTVADVDGSPIRSAKARLLDASGAVITRVQPDRFGRFAFSGLEPGMYGMDLSAPGFSGLRLRKLRVTAGEPTTLPALTLQLASSGSSRELSPLLAFLPESAPVGALSGTVMKGSKEPVQGALVWLLCHGKRCAETSTDASGQFRFAGLESAWYAILVAWPGFFVAEVAAEVTRGFEASYDAIVLEPCQPGRCAWSDRGPRQ
jgi:carboxypeptidase family protein